MPDTAQVLRTTGADAPETSPPIQPCVMLIFGASGDLTKRLLVPALYNLACDGLLPPSFALLGTAMDVMITSNASTRINSINVNARPESLEAGERRNIGTPIVPTP